MMLFVVCVPPAQQLGLWCENYYKNANYIPTEAENGKYFVLYNKRKLVDFREILLKIYEN